MVLTRRYRGYNPPQKVNFLQQKIEATPQFTCSTVLNLEQAGMS